MQQGLADHKFGHSPFGFRTDDGFIAREDRELRGNPQIPPDDERRQHGAIEGIGEGDDIGDATAGAVTCVFRTILNTDSDPS